MPIYGQMNELSGNAAGAPLLGSVCLNHLRPPGAPLAATYLISFNMRPPTGTHAHFDIVLVVGTGNGPFRLTLKTCY